MNYNFGRALKVGYMFIVHNVSLLSLVFTTSDFTLPHPQFGSWIFKTHPGFLLWRHMDNLKFNFEGFRIKGRNGIFFLSQNVHCTIFTKEYIL